MCSGKIFRHSRKRIVAEREGKSNDIEERYTILILQIEVISCKKGKEKEKDYQLILVVEDCWLKSVQTMVLLRLPKMIPKYSRAFTFSSS
jgi:hypothetical protein